MGKLLKTSSLLFLVVFVLFSFAIASNATTSTTEAWQNSNSSYFEVIEQDAPVYINKSGKLVKIAELEKGHTYPRISDYGPNWHKIQYSDGVAFVSKSSTLPSTKDKVSAENTNYTSSNVRIEALSDVEVYDTSNGSLEQMGTILEGETYKIVSDYGGWWRIVYSGRVGYISKSATKSFFSPTDQYFRADVGDTPIYDNRSGGLKKVGQLEKGQLYPRVSDYGNWHRIQVGNYYGYVSKTYTSLAQVNSVPGENQNYTSSDRNITIKTQSPVYDNSTGELVEIGKIDKGAKVSIVSDYGSWWRIIYSDRVGYIHKDNTRLDFKMHDEYFRVTNESTPVYDNRSGSLKKIGELKAGTTFPRVSDYGKWHRVKFGDYYGYVNKQNTEAVRTSFVRNETNTNDSYNRSLTTLTDVSVYDNSNGKLTPIGNIDEGIELTPIRKYGSNWWEVNYLNRKAYISDSFVKENFLPGDQYFEAIDNAPVYDNRTGKLVEVGQVLEGEVYRIHSNYGNWWRIDFGNFYGYVRKENTGYSSSSKEMNWNSGYNDTNKKIRANSEVFVYDNSSGELKPFAKLTKGTIFPIASDYGSWYRIVLGDRVGYVSKSKVQQVGISYTNYDLEFSRMLDIQVAYGTPKYDGAGKIEADEANVSYYLNPSNFNEGTNEFLQFMVLDRLSGLTASEINNNFLKDAGVLSGKGNAFIQAGKENTINELYLLAHALHETGYGKSTLAIGIGVNNKGEVQRDEEGNIIRDIDHEKVDHIVYNMYGYGAYDDNPINGGAKLAFNEGWFTPEAAVIGGAERIANSYIGRGQNTLYKMKWDPEYAADNNSLGRQYATHVMWPSIQARMLSSMLGEDVHNFSLRYDIPIYENHPSADGAVPPPPSQTDFELKEYPTGVIGVVINTDGYDLNIRKGPSTNYDAVGSLSEGETISLIGDDDGNWIKISYNSTEGWVHRDYVDVLNLYYVNDSPVNYRNEPAGDETAGSLSHEYIALSLDSNQNIVSEEAELDGTTYTWYRINVEGTNYWMASDFLEKID